MFKLLMQCILICFIGSGLHASTGSSTRRLAVSPVPSKPTKSFLQATKDFFLPKKKTNLTGSLQVGGQSTMNPAFGLSRRNSSISMGQDDEPSDGLLDDNGNPVKVDYKPRAIMRVPEGGYFTVQLPPGQMLGAVAADIYGPQTSKIQEGPLAAPGTQLPSRTGLSRIGTRISAALPRLPSRDDVRAGFSIAKQAVKDAAIRTKRAVGNTLAAAKTKLTPLDIHQARVGRDLKTTQAFIAGLRPEEGEHVRGREKQLLKEQERLNALATKSSIGRRMLRGTANAVRNAPANVRALYNRRRINKQKQIQEIAAAEARDAQIRADGQAGLIAAYREKLAKLAKSDNADDAKYNRIVAKLRKLGSEAEGFRLPPPPPPTYSEHNFRSDVLRSDPLQPPPPGSALGGFNPQ